MKPVLAWTTLSAVAILVGMYVRHLTGHAQGIAVMACLMILSLGLLAFVLRR